MSYSVHGYQGQNGHSNGHAQQLSDTVTFAPNVPEKVALKYGQPKLVNGRWGDRCMFSLDDGRIMFVDPDVAESIRTLGIQPHQEFTITKRVDGKRTEWDVRKITSPTHPQPAAAMAMGIDETELERDLRLSLEQRGVHVDPPAQPHTIVADGRPQTKLADALRTVVAAIHQAQQYAEQIGFKAMPQFTSEDIRTMANTLIIDGQRNSRG